jgi:hypothetical protein
VTSFTVDLQETHPRTEWYAFLHEASEVNPKILGDILIEKDAFEESFFGHALKDPNM